MNINRFQTSLEYLGQSGNTLSTEKNVILKTTMTVLQKENHFREVFLWGQILGLQKDYYVAYGYEEDILYGRVFYYSVDGINWGLLPRPTAEHRNLALTCSSRFQGDPAYVEDVAKDAPATWNEEDAGGPSPNTSAREDKELQDIPPEGGPGGDAPSFQGFPEVTVLAGTIKEENRLAAIVELVNEEAALVPRGALVKRHDGYVVPNNGFCGLNTLESLDLKSFFHFRPPVQKWNTNLLVAGDNYNFSLDFLDTIDRDIPDGLCWSQQKEFGGRVGIMRNLYWPGATFYHCLHEKEHGFLYVGYGRREIDLPFML